MSKHWSMRNLLAMFDTSMKEIIQYLEDGEVEKAKDRALKMKSAADRMMRCCESCGMDIVEGL